MSAEYICYQGEFFRKDKPFMGLNRAFKYGDGCFESMRAFQLKVPLLSMHFDRLKATLAYLKIEPEKDFFKELESALKESLIRNGLDGGARLRLSVFRRGEGKFESQDDGAAYLIEAEESSEKFELNKKGLRIAIANSIVLYPSPLSSMKLIASQPYILAAIEKKQSEFDELVLCNDSGDLVEASSSNLFLVKADKVYTPPLSSGCLNGVMRAFVMDQISKLGYKLEEKSLKPIDLEKAEEVFLSNASNGVRWVGSYKKGRYFKKVSEAIIDQLNQNAA